eukprot:792623-Prymnesium_polylepis.1
MALHVSPSLMRSACTNSTSERVVSSPSAVSLIQSPEPNPAADRRRARVQSLSEVSPTREE